MRLALAILTALWLISGPEAGAAFFAEGNAFNAAKRAFEDGSYDRAEREFGEFAKKFPKSDRRPEAVLLQAQARYTNQNYTGAVEVLTQNLKDAGKWADQYHFWTAEALMQSGDFDAAAKSYAEVVRAFPGSPRRPAAIYGEAFARFRQGDWPGVTRLLRAPEGAFQQFIKAKPKDELAPRGFLLLGEAWFAQKQLREAEDVLRLLPDSAPTPELGWRRQYLLCRIQRFDGRVTEALAGTTNLFTFATAAGRPRLQTLSVALRAEILEQLNLLPEAVAAWEKNIIAGEPAERREALLKIIELTLAQNQTAETVRKLEQFAAQHPRDPALDVAQLTLGELRVRQFRELAGTNALVAATAAQTNLLQQAITNLTGVITGFTNSPALGQAHLQRGWALWHLGRAAESQADFQAAAGRLPHSLAQAVARFKLADTQFQQHDLTNAMQNFTRVVADYGGDAQVKPALLDQALYQLLRAGIEAGNLSTAESALRKILDWFPESYYGDRALLLYGQALNQRGQPGAARAAFTEFLNRFPGSALAAETRLAVARTFIQEQNWPAAAAIYDEWTTLYPQHPAMAQTEFDRAWVHDQAGHGTNALMLFTNFVARFATDTRAPLAQNWVADYFFNQGKFVDAEAGYQRLFQNTNCPPEMAFQARLSAGRAAFARLGFADARSYFTNLLSEPKCPPEVAAEALFGLGDTFLEDRVTDPARPLERFADAINAFSRITEKHGATRIAPLAWGKIGNCHLQLAAQDTNRYALAILAFKSATEHPQADFTARGLAEFGLGTVAEKQGLPAVALDHFQNVFYYEKNLRPGEQPNPAVVKEAGLAAARLLEEQQRWAEAIQVYRRLGDLLPALRAALEKKIERAGEHLPSGKNSAPAV